VFIRCPIARSNTKQVCLCLQVMRVAISVITFVSAYETRDETTWQGTMYLRCQYDELEHDAWVRGAVTS
jgi:hypothetical protein